MNTNPFSRTPAAGCSTGATFWQPRPTVSSGIALASLLARDGLLAAAESTPLRPPIRPTRRWRARRPHFPAKAKRVLVIFCSGACSHLDTWDYKPELIKRHGKPMPGSRQAGHVPGQDRAT